MFRHMLTKCPKLQEIYSEDSITAKFSKKLDWLIGYEDDIMSQLIVDGFRMEYLDLMAADAYAVTEDVLKYITRKVSKLKYLKFHTKLDFEEISESLKLDQLESLHIVSEFRGLLKRSSVIKIHQQCPKLKHLKLDQHWGAWQQLFVWKGDNNL
ncbi:hypothetical protein HDE_00643 [Halotydeus destructor]|nr:hypothetical protein HDE_00643 [Halotydeus destructor]